MNDKLKTAVSILNECKNRGYYDKPIPDSDDKIISLAETFVAKAKEQVDKGKGNQDIQIILNLGKGLEPKDKDEERFESLVLDDIDGLPNPFKPEDIEPMPYNLDSLTPAQIMKFLGIYNSCAAYANHMYSIEEASEAAAKIIADEAYDEWLVKAEKKDPETNKAKTNVQLVAEAMTSEPRIKKWRDIQKEHEIKAGRFKRLKDIYNDNCERLSRAFTAIQDERKYTNG